ncbi:MAG: DUF3987 domain-containing protein [Ruminococcus sp.]|uniref:YfjI family protein n=1 Tax=Ruminococcus sp. TaxID=41978 RepID=UPI0025DEB907|nr:YfjI family protein [Ruminococcus sp.]MBO4867959.1 DUF3987 domain-containing protein [Ruminococcus sp.]
MSKEAMAQSLKELVFECIIRKEPERSEYYTHLMDMARSYGLEKELERVAKAVCLEQGEPDLWELPKSFEGSAQLPKLTESCLPSKLWDYLKAVSEYVQVAPEMCVLPLMSVLSMCVQGKAVIRHPKNAHTEPLNIYTMTIAAPGERKSGSFKEFIRPVNEYQIQHNQELGSAINNYKMQKTFLERQRDTAMKGQKADLKKAQEFDKQLADLKEVHELKLYVKDTTPEALAGELAKQGERLAILDDEGSVFDVLTGLYSNGQVNINILLEAYDGTLYTVSRKTSDDITLHNPLLTVGLMVQPAHYADAMGCKQFTGRGFIHRFLFAFPEARAGYLNFQSPDISLKLRKDYHDLVQSLLVIPYPQENIPQILHSPEAAILFEDYHDCLQRQMQQGERFENMKEWASKQFARALRVAGIFHIIGNSDDIIQAVQIPLSGETAFAALEFCRWSEAQAYHALSGEGAEGDTVRNAKLILDKLRKLKVDEITKGELLAMKINRLTSHEITEPLDMLADLNYIKILEMKNGQRGKPKVIIQINPNIKK